MSIKDDLDEGICILSFGKESHFREKSDNVLSNNPYHLDSCGPGTYSQLLLVKEYAKRLATDLGVHGHELCPADHFDLIGGVGFGGYVCYIQ
jgi:hypothetical protein